MQLICEAYYILKHAAGLSNQELFEVFAEWNKGDLESYLIEITRDIFTVIDPDTNEHLVDKILDTAQQKGICLEDLQLRPRLRATRRCCRRIRLEAE